ncbi:MAG: tRNA 2-thiouridine(34) synthase MnmA, partial [Clostridiales bacterium]|nr:tRNA 2-thiouridine(34) synthase MnmA [Clostridiales bacterium]
MEKKRVLVAMSGGVDSSAAALLLQQQGYACDGAMLKLYSGEVEGTCCSADDADDARSVAYRLGMKFYVFNETERFARDVMDHFVAEYCVGHTPNPCIDCNRCLKFGALLERALVLGYDYLATGHYARVGYDPETGLYRLLRGRDRRKDQSYVLYQLTQHQLSHLLLPVGEFDKPAIRESARAAGLLNADKADSQDICFVPDGDYGRFLREYGHVEMTPGDFVDREGRVLGRHKGLPCYTTGQRKGLGVSAGRHVYVVRKNAADNTILLGDNEELYARELTACRVNWISGTAPTEPVAVTAKTRYSQTEAEAESLRQMGDPVEVGTQLDRVHRPAPQWGMLALVGLLLCSGFFIQATVMQQLGRVQPYMPTVIVSILLGVAAMAAVYLGDYTLLGRRPVLLYGLGMTGLVLLTVTSEVKAQGVKLDAISYLLLGPVLYALLVYGLRGKGWRGLLLALAGLVPPVVLPCLIPNFTSGAIAGLSGAAVVLTAAWKGWMGVPRKKGAAAVAVGLLVLNGAALWHLSQSPYALERVRFALHPELDPLGLGYFPMMVREMLSGAQWLGKGELGELSGAAGYLPGVSDYWLARVIHELGWAAGLALLALMTALFALGLRRCMRQRGMLGRLLSTAALTTLVLETVCFVVYDLG